MKNFLGTGLLAGVLFSAQLSFASMDWTDFCKPDLLALARAAQDFPTDRFEQSRCVDSVYHRGTCAVTPHAPSSGKESEIRFSVKLQTNAGIFRNYELQMFQGVEEPCLLKSIRRKGQP